MQTNTKIQRDRLQKATLERDIKIKYDNLKEIEMYWDIKGSHKI